MTLPAGTIGDEVVFIDYAGTFDSYTLTIAADGSVDDRVHVLEIDKLLDKDSSTMSSLASFCGISVSDEAATTIDTFKSDIA